MFEEDQSSEGGPKGSFENFKAEGDVLFKQGEYKKALESYTTALELKNGDKNCLVARSQCYLKLADSNAALNDAEMTLVDDPNYIKGIFQKAEALYQKGEFEFSLMFYHRGNKLRPEVQGFRLGIQKAQEAIDNSIGDNAGIQLENKGDLSFFHKQEEKVKAKTQRGGYNKPIIRKEEKKETRRPLSSLKDTKTVKQLLGELYADREYLEKLLKETESAGRKTETNMAIRNLCLQGLEYLDTRTEFWQQQKPMYSRKRDRVIRDSARATSAKQDPTQWVLHNLEEIDDAQANGNYEKSLKQAKNTLKEVDKWSNTEVQNRVEVVSNLHSCLGNAYLELGDYNKALHHHNIDLEIANQNNLDESKSRALDNLGRVYARVGKFNKAIQVWEEKLPMSKSALESTWLYHEIGRCHLELGHYQLACNYGEKSLEAAQQEQDQVWQLNASVLIAQACVKLKQYSEALNSFQQALEIAKLQDDGAAQSAINKAIEDVNQRIAKSLRTSEDTVADDKSCVYILEVFTGDKPMAGTDALVTCCLFGMDKNSGDHTLVDNMRGKDKFERGGIDEFQLECGDLGEIVSLKIGHNGDGIGDGWFLHKVNVKRKDEEDKILATFYCDRWLDSGEDDGKLIRKFYVDKKSEDNKQESQDDQTDEYADEEFDDEVTYTITTHTGNKFGSGTDANVFIQLFGVSGETQEKKLEDNLNGGNKFEKGNVDTFQLKFMDIGELKKVRLRHDGEGVGNGWYVDKVEIEKGEYRKTLICDRWLDEDEEDGKLYLEIEL